MPVIYGCILTAGPPPVWRDRRSPRSEGPLPERASA
jgi:hypothetical protein